MNGTPSSSVTVTCTACGQPATVPFTPTPGRPVYCRACFAKRSDAPGPGGRAGGPRPGGGGGFRRPTNDLNRTAPKKRMMAQGRKSHFVYDAMEVLARNEARAEEQSRTFVEMLFARGSRQSTDAAHGYLEEKVADSTISEKEAESLARLVQKYSFYR